MSICIEATISSSGVNSNLNGLHIKMGDRAENLMSNTRLKAISREIPLNQVKNKTNSSVH